MGHPTNEELAAMFEQSLYIRNTIDSDPYERIPALDLETDFAGLVGAITDLGVARGGAKGKKLGEALAPGRRGSEAFTGAFRPPQAEVEQLLGAADKLAD